MNTIKCLFCNNIFCVDHYPIHKTYHDSSKSEERKQERKNAGALITYKDLDYGKPCIVCSTITQYSINKYGDIVNI